MTSTCPICRSTAFKDYNGRSDAICLGCGALERTRYLWLFIERCSGLSAGRQLLHVSPDKCLIPMLHGLLGTGYTAADIDPRRYKNDLVEVKQLDLCEGLAAIPDASYDMVMHLHVLEHVPCPLEKVFSDTMRILKPGGQFVFALPIGPGITIENLWPDVPSEERTKVFGQHDHLRLVGSVDFPLFLRRVVGAWDERDDYRVDPDVFSSEAELAACAIPYERTTHLSGDCLFRIQKSR